MTYIAPGYPARIDFPGSFLHGQIVVVRHYFQAPLTGDVVLAAFEARPAPGEKPQSYALPARMLRPAEAKRGAA